MTYTIKKGQHACNHLLETHAGTTAEKRTVTVHPSWQTGTKQTTIHKLWGYSYGFHHDCSARLGLKLLADKFRLMAYVYDGGLRIRECEQKIKITELPYGSTFESEIIFDLNRWIFTVNDKTTVVKTLHTFAKVGYFLYPYFGGKETAPHDIKTIIKS